jgi:hypothetical protein
MTISDSYNPMVEDPLIARMHLDTPLDADCLRAAIRYNLIHIEIRQKNIEVLSKALDRLLNTPLREPALQESARRAMLRKE